MGLFKIAFRNVFRNRRRSLLSATAISVAVISIIILFGLIDGMRRDLENNLIDFVTGDIRVRPTLYEKYERYNPIHLTLPYQEIAKQLDSMDGIDSYVGRINFPASLYVDEKNRGALGIALDFSNQQNYYNFSSILKEGQLPTKGKNELLIGSTLATKLNLKLDDKVTILSTTAQRGANAITLKIVGIASFAVANIDANQFWIDLELGQYFLKMGDEVNEFLIKTEKKDITVLSSLKETLPYEVKSLKENSMIYNLIDITYKSYYLVALFFFLLGSSVIFNTTMMVVYERMKEIGTLRALGLKDRSVIKLFLAESGIISFAGTFVGFIIGSVITLILNKTGIDFTASLTGVDIDISNVIYPYFNLFTAILVSLYAIGVSLLATLAPSFKAVKLEIVETLNYV